ncbi:DNA polymerase III subunit chi [Larsenimonas suaedae]|uniref:DNA polymerase III subunit chi n=1 Tax=Larsenimonas suaedae TaxID=1851019 RepID=A0ABU1GU33_9GAMM|nr:DNA polymerase III subunit chi [Larsenimonas suaedae]MCM2972120.1 DNA polymerase III subunit chi [Larsenimonas suaedae]MDR5895086.1 DNA polymerase III subunit chi [Larsenimonas suaedae]
MTQIDFYILPQTTLEARFDFACRLAETIFSKGYRLHVHCEDEAMARQMDERLWTFKPESYIPHTLVTEPLTPKTPVTIGWDHEPEPGVEALLNLHPEIPSWFSHLERVAEIINQHQEVLVAKRACWSTYKERGYPVKAHQLKG